jgi:hypothetical protein
VRALLTQLIAGQPLFVLSRQGCPTLRTGFLGKYIFRKLRLTDKEIYKDEPEKDQYSHLQDCLQYGALYFTNLMKKTTVMPDMSMLVRKGTRF